MEDLGNISLERQSKHYTGSIVVKVLGDKLKFGKAFKQLEIIDGQQRLASLTILVHCICERLNELTLEDADKTARNLESEYIQDNSTGVYKLRLNGNDDAFLKDVVLKTSSEEMVGKEPTTPSERRLIGAKTYFLSKLNTMDFDVLNQLIEKTLNRLLFIRYEVGSEVEAGLVFEAMNDRGKPLTQVDKIKNYLIYLAYRKDDSDLATSINQAWGEIFKNVMETDKFDEDDLLRYHWIMLRGESKEYNVHRRLKGIFNLLTDDITNAVRQYITSLKEASYVFRELNSPDTAFTDWNGYEDIQDVREYLNGLHRLRNIATFMPLLMASRIVCKESPWQFRNVCEACESFAFRVYKVGNKRADTGYSKLCEYARQLFAARASPPGEVESTSERILNEVYDWLRYYVDDQEFTENLKRQNLTWWLDNYEIRYLLYELEKRKCKEQSENSPEWESIQDTTIEHIWPQNPRNYDTWSEELKEEHQKSYDKLGNLTLTFWNPELSNRDFAEKREMYAKSNLIIQRELKNLPAWGSIEVGSRTDNIVAFALERWKSSWLQ